MLSIQRGGNLIQQPIRNSLSKADVQHVGTERSLACKNMGLQTCKKKRFNSKSITGYCTYKAMDTLNEVDLAWLECVPRRPCSMFKYGEILE